MEDSHDLGNSLQKKKKKATSSDSADRNYKANYREK